MNSRLAIGSAAYAGRSAVIESLDDEASLRPIAQEAASQDACRHAVDIFIQRFPERAEAHRLLPPPKPRFQERVEAHVRERQVQSLRTVLERVLAWLGKG